MAQKISWFYESAAERARSGYEAPSSSFGAYQKEGVKTLDEHFHDLHKQYKESYGVDIKNDMRQMVFDRTFMEEYKTALMEPISEGFREISPNDPHIEHMIENVNRFWDTKVRNYTESASMTGFLPIATLEFPVLLKQFFQTILKDIIEVETVKTPNITKHIRSTFMVNNQTGEELEYPKCMFDGTWEQMYDAAKGYPIRQELVPLPDGRIHRYNIITSLTDGTPGLDMLSFQFKIVGIQYQGGEVFRIPGNGVTVEFSTNGTLVNGDFVNRRFVQEDGTEVIVNATLSGMVNFRAGTIDLSSSTDDITGVVFEGYLSNEKNLRHISVREKRDILRFTIEDGARWNMPFTIEEIDDAAALLDMNYYNRMVDEVVRTMEMIESQTVIRFLNNEFEKYHNVETDIYALESLAMTYLVDLMPPDYFAGDPFKYISTAIQFRLKAMIHQMTEAVKLDNLSFIIAGNPMSTQLITEFVNWKVQQGSNIGGITVNNSYGFATDMGANVRVVASNIYDAYTVDPVSEIENSSILEPTNARELILHIYAYPTTPEHISFRHLKYTSHILTSQSQTAYQSTNAPGGAYNIITATARWHTMSVQGIQGRLIMLNSERVYGPAPVRPPITGAPWAGLPDFGTIPDPGTP